MSRYSKCFKQKSRFFVISIFSAKRKFLTGQPLQLRCEIQLELHTQRAYKTSFLCTFNLTHNL